MKKLLHLPLLQALLTTVVMLALTFAYWTSEQKELVEKRQHAFIDSADQITSNIRQQLFRYELMLRGVKGFYEGSNFVKATDYQKYFEALQLKQTLPSLQTVAIALSVPKEHVTNYVADMHKRGMIDFHIKPEGSRESYVPLSLIEPYVGSNLSAIGFDLESNPNIRARLMQARDTGDMALTRKINLVQDAGKDVPAVVMYIPIYDNRLRIGTLAERRKAIVGWVSGPIRLHDLMADLNQQLDADIGIEIYDGDTLSASSLLYGKNKVYATSASGTALQTRQIIDIGGERWTLATHTLPAFDARFSQQNQVLIASGGVILSLLLGWMVWLLGHSRDRAVAMAYTMTKELRETQADLESTLNAMPDILFELGLDGRYYNFHTSRHSLLAAPPNEILGKLISDILPEKAAATCLEALHEANISGFSSGKQIEIPLGKETHWFELSVARKDNGKPDNPHFIMISHDITERKLAKSQLTIAAIAFESQEGIMVTDAKSVILRVNRAFTDITGYTAEEVIGKTPNLLSSGRQDKHFYAEMWDGINHKGLWAGEIWNRRKDGEIYPEYLTITEVKDANDIVTNYVAMLTDITLSKAATDEIKMLAFYDPLTKLPNRRLLLDRLNQALAASSRSRQKGALFFLDLDHFKSLNDTLGHDVGDLLLQQVATRLVDCVREGDTVARLGGDEFVVLLENLSEHELEAAAHSEHVAEKILESLSQPYQLGAHECHSTPSIGATIFDNHLFGVDELLKQADIAMYEAKNSGRNALRFFDPKMQEAIASRVDLEHELRKAIELKQFQLHYQIQVDSNGHALGAEALIRWQHPERGMISPFHFIPLAEDTGLILQIGQWVLETACAQLQLWEQDDLTSNLVLAVNVSAKQFLQEDFVIHIASAIQRNNINPTRLKLELTESMLVNNIKNIISKMDALNAIGIRFSLDDFGTGYSSLQYLKMLPLNQLKIDQSFVRDITTDSSDRAIVRTIIAMAQSMDINVIAEGVETTEQQQFLLANGCLHYQGYLFSKPLPIDAFNDLLRTS